MAIELEPAHKICPPETSGEPLDFSNLFKTTDAEKANFSEHASNPMEMMYLKSKV